MPPVNDNFASAAAISSSNGSDGPYTITDATTEGSEPAPSASGQISQSIWFVWTAPATGSYEFDTDSSDNIDTVLAVYTGTVLASLVEVASDDDAGVGSRSKLHFAATSGTTYRIQAGCYNSSTVGQITLAWRVYVVPVPDHLAFQTPPKTEIAQYSYQSFQVHAYDAGSVDIEGIPITMTLTSNPTGIPFPPQTVVTVSFGAFFPQIQIDTLGTYTLTFSSPGVASITATFTIVAGHLITGAGRVNVHRQGEWHDITTGKTRVRVKGNWIDPCASGQTHTVYVRKGGSWQKACGEAHHAVNVDKWDLAWYVDGSLVQSYGFWWASFIPPENNLNTSWAGAVLPFNRRLSEVFSIGMQGYKPLTQNGAKYGPTYTKNGPTVSWSAATDPTTAGVWVFNPTEIHSDTLFAGTSQRTSWFPNGTTTADITLTFQWAVGSSTHNMFAFSLSLGDISLGGPDVSFSMLPGHVAAGDAAADGSSGFIQVGGPIGLLGNYSRFTQTDGPGASIHLPELTFSTIHIVANYVGMEVRPVDPSDFNSIKW